MSTRSKLAIGICVLVASFLSAFWLNIPTLNEKTLSFSSAYGDHDVILEGSIWEVKDAEYAALICPGYSCDRQKWKPTADLLVANGITTMSFDYSGQGASSGTIGFDNAKTDRIPEQISDAIEVLHERTGIAYDHIILVGHSMGGRSILRLLYDYNCPEAETKVQFQDIRNVILMSPEVNYEFNAQASLFAGTSDDSQEPWHSYNPSYLGGTNVYLFGSTQDDIVSDRDMLAIYRHIGGSNVPESGIYQASQTNPGGAHIALTVTSGILHSYMMYSPRIGGMVNEALTEITGKTSTYPAWKFMLTYFAWFTALIGLGFTLSGLNGRLISAVSAPEVLPRLTDPRRFLIRKALMWIPGTLAAFLVCCICVVMPFGSPVMNIPYMCFIAGYGFVMALAYRKGTFKGTEGKLPAFTLKVSGERKNMLVCAAVSLGLIFAVWFILRATMYRLIPLNARLFWVCFAAAAMTVGYYVSGCEADMLKAAGASRLVRGLYNLIQYVPLLLLILFYLVLKSYSGMIGQIQNMILMYIFCVPLGNYIRRSTGNRLLGALSAGFLFQTLMITSAALIALF